MPSTTNFGWTTPADTDLVKDGASAIRTLGNGIDTSFVDLKGGTTGQVLSKNSNTDLDFTWVAQDDSNAIQNALLTTTGDTIYASSASTPARLGIGTTGQVLTVSGGVPVWSTPSAGALTQLATGNLSGLSSVNITSISQSYKNLVLLLRSVQHINGEETRMRLNNVSTALYARTIMLTSAATLSQSSGLSYWFLQDTTGQGANDSAQVITINNYTNGGHPTTFASWDGNSSGRGCFGVFGASQTGLNGSITQINLFLNSGTWAAGNYTLFGEN